jgi:hypothetical protein
MNVVTILDKIDVSNANIHALSGAARTDMRCRDAISFKSSHADHAACRQAG